MKGSLVSRNVLSKLGATGEESQLGADSELCVSGLNLRVATCFLEAAVLLIGQLWLSISVRSMTGTVTGGGFESVV